MRNIIKLLFYIVILVFLMSSCGRYENGPECSLYQVKTRISGLWKINEIYLDDDLQEMQMEKEQENTLLINKKGTFEYIRLGGFTKSATDTVSGVWTFSDDKIRITFLVEDSINGDIKRIYKITRLTTSELWMIDEDDPNYMLEKHYKKQ